MICPANYIKFLSIPFQSADRDLDGTLNFPEFVRLMRERRAARKDVDECTVFREAFKVFDKDGSGKITRAELRCSLEFCLKFSGVIFRLFFTPWCQNSPLSPYSVKLQGYFFLSPNGDRSGTTG